MKRALVTGGAGFIGSHLVERLLKEGHEVTVLDDLSQGNVQNLSSVQDKTKFVKGGYGDRDILRPLLENTDVVYHYGAMLGVQRVLEDPWRVLELNNSHLHTFFDEVRRSNVSKVVYASSSEVYGDAPPGPLKETDPVRPFTPYQSAKLIGEVYVQALWEQFGIDGASVRYFNVFGPRQDSSPYGFVISIFLKNALRRQPNTIFGTGEQTRDFTHVHDAVDGAVRAAANVTEGGVYNIGTGREISILNLSNLIGDLTSVRAGVEFAPERPHEIHHRVANLDRARKELGYSPKISLEEGLSSAWKSMTG